MRTQFTTTKSLNKETLQETLNKLAKLHDGKNSYYVENDSFHEDINKDQVIENVKDLFTSDHETPLPQDNIKEDPCNK